MSTFSRGEERKIDSYNGTAGAVKQQIDSTGEIQCIPKDFPGFALLLLRPQFVVMRN